MTGFSGFEEMTDDVKWPIVPVRDVATAERNAVSADQVHGDELYVGLENVTSDGVFENVVVASKANLKSNKFAFTEDHVLYGKLRPYLAKIAAPDFAGICSTDILPIRPSTRLDRRYLLYFLRTPMMVARAASNAVGINLPRLNPKTLESFEIPLPPIGEQRRIAAILDAADALRAKRRQTLAKLDDLTQSIFHEQFIRANGWPGSLDTTLGEIAEIVSGSTPKTGVERYWNGDVWWATPKDLSEITSPYIDATERTLSEAGLQSCSASVLPAHSVLLSSRAPIGYVAINTTPMATNQGFKNFVLDSKCVDPRFLYSWLRFHRPQLQAMGSGATFKEISKRTVSSVPIRLPTIEKQREFGEVFDKAEALRITAEHELTMHDTLFASLQQRAFRGEL